jgi:ABC-type Mn2+/Zn2+ transport system ATPase subunit
LSVSYVPQRERIERIIPITVFEVVLMGLSARTPALQGIRRAQRDAADRALALLDIESLGPRLFRNLSTGQQ